MKKNQNDNLNEASVDLRISRKAGRTLLIGLEVLVLAVFLARPVAAKQSFGQASDIFNIGAGARSMAMGGAFTGLADDASAPYFNPAGLAFLDEHQLMVMHAPLFVDSKFNYLSSAHPFGDKWGAVAISDALLSSDGFAVRDASNVLIDNNGDLSKNAIFGTYARKINQQISAGVNLKLIQQKIVGMSDSAMGVDLGVMYRPSRLFSAGFAYANANEPEVTLQSEADIFRPITRFGLASEVFADKLTLTADIYKVSGQDQLISAGVEFTPTKIMQLRTGFNANRSYTLGLGLNLKPFRIDYAFSDTDLGAFNKVSFTWAWHNIYKTDLEPPMKEGRAVFPLQGFENQVAFKSNVPAHVVARWSLQIKDGEGKPVRTLEGDLRPPEMVVWDAKNAVGEPVIAGIYNYNFTVTYKNGKRWINIGNIDLALPNHRIQEVIDMSLQLNGAKDGEMNEAAIALQQEQSLTRPAVLAPEMPETPAAEAPVEAATAENAVEMPEAATQAE